MPDIAPCVVLSRGDARCRPRVSASARPALVAVPRSGGAEGPTCARAAVQTHLADAGCCGKRFRAAQQPRVCARLRRALCAQVASVGDAAQCRRKRQRGCVHYSSAASRARAAARWRAPSRRLSWLRVQAAKPSAVNVRPPDAPRAASATRRSASRAKTRLKTFAARSTSWTPKGTGASTQMRWSKSSSSSGTSASGCVRADAPRVAASAPDAAVPQSDIEDMIWEVDDDCDKSVTWTEFQAMFSRCRNDKTGACARCRHSRTRG